MFATLFGRGTETARQRGLFDQLCGIAVSRGFTPPDTALRVQADGPLDGMRVEQFGPQHGDPDFLLAVMAPRVPGMSPIYPVYKSVAGPLFAVVVLAEVFMVSRADRPDVTEHRDERAVAASFEEFIAALSRARAR